MIAFLIRRLRLFGVELLLYFCWLDIWVRVDRHEIANLIRIYIYIFIEL